MDSLQPSGSFKIRGIGHKCYKDIVERKKTRLISSSGGNAGLATAYSGKVLGAKVTVVVPESTSQFMREKIQEYNAEVIVHGQAWDEANEFALNLVEKHQDSAYIHPFDHPEIWEGHSSIIKEIFHDHNMKGIKPAAIVTVVGGGGLLCGILEGLHQVGWTDVPIIACETEGADSFAQSVKQGHRVTLPAITSIAKTLGAKTVCKEVFEWTKKHEIKSVVLSDKEASKACLQFADDHRTLVEPACGVGLAAIYEKIEDLTEILKRSEKSDSNPVIIAIVCGGNGVSLKMLQEWKEKFNI